MDLLKKKKKFETEKQIKKNYRATKSDIYSHRTITISFKYLQSVAPTFFESFA